MGNWEQYLEENYDGDKEKAKEQRNRDKTEAREIADKVSELYKESQEVANIKEYLTDGAILWCDKPTLDDFVLDDGTKISLSSVNKGSNIAVGNRERREKLCTKLYVKEGVCK